MIGRTPIRWEDKKDDSMDMNVEKPYIYYRCVMYGQTDGLTDRQTLGVSNGQTELLTEKR